MCHRGSTRSRHDGLIIASPRSTIRLLPRPAFGSRISPGAPAHRPPTIWPRRGRVRYRSVDLPLRLPFPSRLRPVRGAGGGTWTSAGTGCSSRRASAGSMPRLPAGAHPGGAMGAAGRQHTHDVEDLAGWLAARMAKSAVAAGCAQAGRPPSPPWPGVCASTVTASSTPSVWACPTSWKASTPASASYNAGRTAPTPRQPHRNDPLLPPADHPTTTHQPLVGTRVQLAGGPGSGDRSANR